MTNSRGYGTPRWRTARARALAKHPRCTRCGAHQTLVVHHADEQGMTGSRAIDQGNLIVLCRRCHNDTHGNHYKP